MNPKRCLHQELIDVTRCDGACHDSVNTHDGDDELDHLMGRGSTRCIEEVLDPWVVFVGRKASRADPVTAFGRDLRFALKLTSITPVAPSSASVCMGSTPVWLTSSGSCS